MSDRLLVSTRKGLFLFERRGAGSAGWSIQRTAFLGDPVSMALPDPRDGTIYAALNLGHFGVKLRRSSDSGATWEDAGAPSYPPEPDAEGPKTAGQTSEGRTTEGQTEGPETGEPKTEGGKPSLSLKLIWALETGGADQPGVLWAGTLPGGLFRSHDRGSSWDLVRSLWDRPERVKWFGGGYDDPGIHSICVHPADSRTVLVGVSCGGTWITRDGAETWENCAKGMFADYMPPERRFDPQIQDPHRIVQSPSNPDVLWTQHHNGIFRSTDGAGGWHEIADVAPSSFGFAVAVHPKDPDQAWFVPAVRDEARYPVDGRLVVTRTRDGGKSFEILRAGLPQEHAYDLVYRHGLDVDATGERLAFGSTTGGLWITEDQGDTWTNVSSHLPPIYAVRFVP